MRVSVGAIVVIKLSENPSTGYTWQYAVNENIAEVIEDVYIPPKNQKIGEGGTRKLKLKITGRENLLWTMPSLGRTSQSIISQ